MNEINGYSMSRAWFDFAFENNDLISPNDGILFLWLVELNNRLGWSERFKITSTECMAACGFNTYPPYKKALDNLVKFGFVKIVQASKNQYSANVISISAISKNDKALDKALLKHSTKQVETKRESTFDIHLNQEPINLKPQYTYDDFVSDFQSIVGKKMKGNDKTKNSFSARLKEGFTKEQFCAAMINCKKDKYHMENPHFLTIEFILRNDKLEKFLNIDPPKGISNVVIGKVSGLTLEQAQARMRGEEI